MKIIHIVTSLKIGGLENLVLAMSKIQSQKDMNVLICSLDSENISLRQLYDKDIKIVYPDIHSNKGFRLLRWLYKLFREEKPDIVHTHNPWVLAHGAIIGRLARVRGAVNTRHGEALIKKSPLLWMLNDFVVTVSNSAKEALLKNNRFKKGQLKVIYNGISLPPHEGDDREYGKKNGNFIIGTVSRLTPSKDIPTLILSFKKVSSYFSNANLWIVGDGDISEDLKKLVKVNGLLDKVKFLGWQKDAISIDKKIDVFILSSLTEGISIALLEAMACNCPVVATSVGGNPEVVEDGVTGFLVPPKNPDKMAEMIIKILQDSELAKKMGEAGRRRVEEKFSLDRMVGEYEELYGECLARKGLGIRGSI